MSDDLLAQLLINSGLAQYPDEKLYNAATLLTPDERPTVPVRMKKAPPIRVQNPLEGMFVPEDKTIYVGNKGQAYRNPKRLAAVLAHEAVHARGESREEPAYQQQYDVLKRLGEKDQDLLQALLDRALGGPLFIGSNDPVKRK